MKATFDFIPAYCPNCGKPLFKPPDAAYLQTTAAILADYHRGHWFTCPCGLKFAKRLEAIVNQP
jgi:hypothetical protein